MVIMSVKVNKKLIACAAIIIAAVIIGIAFIIAAASKEELPDTTIVSNVEKGVLASAEDMQGYLDKKGLAMNGSCSVKEVKIPDEFDEVYQQYNALQEESGFDLEKYKGKRVKLWSAALEGFSESESTVRINILTYKDEIIGGDISSVELGGFMRAIEK